MPKLDMNSDVSEICGVGKVKSAALRRLGIHTVSDLLHYFPRAYEWRGNVRALNNGSPDEDCSYVLTVATAPRGAQIKRGFSIYKFRAFDSTGSCELVYFNSPFVKDVFHVGDTFRFFGKIAYKNGKATLTAPKYEPYDEERPLPDYLPVYSLTEGINSKFLSAITEIAMNDVLPALCDPLDAGFCAERNLASLSYALKNVHFPDSDRALSAAIRRLAYDEMFAFALCIASSGKERTDAVGVRIPPCSVKPMTDLFPYELTASQKNAVNEIYRDMTGIGTDGKPRPMARILIGDVGSGKTACAALAAYVAVSGGYQCALMAPTEILARQHYESLAPLFEKLGIGTDLLLGSTPMKEKTRIRNGVSDGTVRFLIGTHALLSDKLNFADLGLIITDEQHRFGVRQRGELKRRTEDAHLLVMSATPIPRTLALAMYGDLDVSRLTELPSGRIPVETYAVTEDLRQRLNAFIEKQVKNGGQCYVVCPAIESTEDDTAAYTYEDIEMNAARPPKLKNVTEYTEELKRALPSLRIGLLHGKMTSEQKSRVMDGFAAGDLDVLVSTTVIEVGINVPRATLMIIENAERFGLSALHQLRGRVGRGKQKSYCILVSSSAGENARLKIMTQTNDGFRIAEEDLKLRGPGDFLTSDKESIRQSGGFTFKMARYCKDSDLMQTAFSDAKALIGADPDLSADEHALIKETYFTRRGTALADIS